MQTRLRLWHRWQQQLGAVLAAVRVTQVRGLALLVLGIVLADTVRLPAIAASLPGAACDESRVRRLRRWLANPRVDVAALWPPVRRTLLHDLAGQRLLLVFDPTPHAGQATLLVVGLVQHKRVLPLAWRVVPQQTAWPAPMATYLGAMVREIAADLPPACHVTLLADRGITSPATIRVVRAAGWHVTFRLNAGPHQSHRVRHDGQDAELWRWLETRRFAWAGPVDLFKDAGWLRLELTVVWPAAHPEPWILLSDEPAGPARVRAYRRRSRIEATFADAKRRGFELDATKVVHADRLDRLVLALTVAMWWRTQLGLRVIHAGLRRRYDRTDRRDKSVVRLGLRALLDHLDTPRGPALPFSHRHGAWRYVLYA